MLKILGILILLNGIAFSKPQIGEPAPAFSMARLNSKDSLSLATFHNKVLFLDFWASWCIPCRRLMPKLSEIKERNPKMELLAVSVDENKTKALTFLRSMEPGLNAAHDASQKVAEAYALEGMPTCFLIDKQGRLRFRHDGYTVKDLVKIEREIELLLAEP